MLNLPSVPVRLLVQANRKQLCVPLAMMSMIDIYRADHVGCIAVLILNADQLFRLSKTLFECLAIVLCPCVEESPSMGGCAHCVAKFLIKLHHNIIVSGVSICRTLTRIVLRLLLSVFFNSTDQRRRFHFQRPTDPKQHVDRG